VGVIGSGRIGASVVQSLSGFGCRILAYDLYEKDEVKQLAAYVPLEQIWKEADVITLHMPLTGENHHIINADTIAKMKDGVIIVNTARGALIDSEALIDAIEHGKIGAAGLDVVENEFGLYYYDHKSDILKNRELAMLRSFPNVTVSHHMAFYTENYVETVVKDSLMSCKLYMEGKENPWEVA
jgi:D-lactate dehydrogenase